ncbi:hypothetical protein [Streptomyces sp. NPDC001743]
MIAHSRAGGGLFFAEGDCDAADSTYRGKRTGFGASPRAGSSRAT